MPLDMQNQFVRAGVILAAAVTWTASVSTIVGVTAATSLPEEVVQFYEYGTAITTLVIALATAFATYQTSRPKRIRLLVGAIFAFLVGVVAMYLAMAMTFEQVRKSRPDCRPQTIVMAPPAPLPSEIADKIKYYGNWGEALCADGDTIRAAAGESNGRRIVNLAMLLLLMTAGFALSVITLTWGMMVNRDRPNHNAPAAPN